VDGVRWTDLAHDVPDSVSEMVHGNLNPIAWLGSFRDVRVDCLLSVQDPLPGVVEMSRKVGRRLRRGLDKVGGSSAVDS
jgi:hypothetical protein